MVNKQVLMAVSRGFEILLGLVLQRLGRGVIKIKEKNGFLTRTDFGDWLLSKSQSPLHFNLYNLNMSPLHLELIDRVALLLLYDTCF
jgi:hypothetical protein